MKHSLPCLRGFLHSIYRMSPSWASIQTLVSYLIHQRLTTRRSSSAWSRIPAHFSSYIVTRTEHRERRASPRSAHVSFACNAGEQRSHHLSRSSPYGCWRHGCSPTRSPSDTLPTIRTDVGHFNCRESAT